MRTKQKVSKISLQRSDFHVESNIWLIFSYRIILIDLTQNPNIILQVDINSTLELFVEHTRVNNRG